MSGREENQRSGSCPVCGGSLVVTELDSHDRLYQTPGTFGLAKCSQCGLGVTLPVVGPDELAALYPSSYGAHEQLLTGMAGRLSEQVQSLLFQRALHTMPLAPIAKMAPGRMLDVGCGRGDLGAQAVKRNWVVAGVEPSPEACAVARQRGVDARQGAVAEVTLEPEAYDVAVFRASLEHVSDPLDDLRRIHGALREGGMVAISVPDFGGWQARRLGKFWFHLDLPRHRHHFNDASLRMALEQTGFTRIQTCSTYTNTGLPASLQYLIFDRCLFPGGLRLRMAMLACALLGPLAWLGNRFVGSGDMLQAVAYKSSR